MKTRLNSTHRRILTQLVEQKVTSPATEDLVDGAKAALGALITDHLTQQWPQADMAVLEKYGCAATVARVRVMDLRDRDSWEFNVPLSKPLSLRYSKLYIRSQTDDPTALCSPEIHRAFDRLIKAHEIHDSETYDKRVPYTALIRASATFEAVLAAWPEAEEVRTKIIPPQLPSIATPDFRALIKADMARRGISTD